MRHPRVMPVGHIQCAVRSCRDIRCGKPCVVRLQQRSPMFRSHRRTHWLHLMPLHTVSQQVTRHIATSIAFRQRVRLVHDPPDGHVAAMEIRMRCVFKVAVCKGILQGSMFTKRFHITGALDSVHQSEPAVVCAVKQSSQRVKVQPPRIPAALAEQLKLTRHRVIPPHTLLKTNTSNHRRHGTALTAIQPAVRPPRQRIGHAVRVFHPKSAQQHFRIRIWLIVLIAVRIEQQVRHI